ncbi:MAG: hypothetical protein HPY66_3534 [Firmicutes bacterium]|nr:hypothetical protein [Bacillota bacterium]MDI6706370.1 YpmA family protein [Bacillota bacterium]
MEQEPKLQLIATKEMKYNDDLYKMVDFLNKTLKNRDLIFGLAMKDDGNMIISIYET